MSFPATSPTKETPGVTFSVTSRRSLDCGRPTTGSDEGNSSRDFEMNRLAVHHSHYRAPTISGNFTHPPTALTTWTEVQSSNHFLGLIVDRAPNEGMKVISF